MEVTVHSNDFELMAQGIIMATVNKSRFAEGLRRQSKGLTDWAAAPSTPPYTTRQAAIAEYKAGCLLIESSYGNAPTGRAAAFQATIQGRTLDNSGTDVSFEDLSYDSLSITGWLWDFGDGNTSTQQNVVHTYTALGTFDVTLTITDASGSDSTTRVGVVEIVRPAITVDFTGSVTSGNAPLSVTFTPTITGGEGVALTYSWDFGDSTTSTEQQPVKVYGSAGTYTVVLSVTEEFGGNITKTRTNYITVSAAPALAVDFSGSPTSGQVPFTVDFTSTVSGGAGGNTYSWNFGDSTTSTQANPSKQYTAAGTYTVSVQVTDSLSATDTETKTNYIVATSPPPPPPLTVNFSGNPVSGNAPLTVDFSSQISGGVGSYTYVWDFGDSTTSTQANPSKQYANPGSYTVALTVTDQATPTPNQQVLTRTNYIGVSQAGSWPTVSASFTSPTFSPSTNESINSGTQVTFAWATTGATTITLTDSGGPQSVAASGTHSKVPTRSETFQITAVDASGLKKVIGRKSVVVKRSLSAVVASGTIATSIASTTNGSGAGVSIPNFWANPTHVSVQSGSFTSGSTWSAGTIPDETSKVEIAAGHTVTVAANRLNICKTLKVLGILDRPTNGTSILHYSDLWIAPGGIYRIATAASPLPLQHKALDIIQNRDFDAATDPNSWGNIVFIQGTLDVWGAVRTQWARAAAHIPAGADFVDVVGSVNWEPGERIVVPRSEQGKPFNTGFTTDDEFVTISHVEDLGNGTSRVYLNAPLTYQHPGVADAETGTIRYRPYLYSLDRNCGWITADPTNTTTRAHCVFDSTATVECHWAVWHGLGRTLRTTVQPTQANSTTRADDFWRTCINAYKLTNGTFNGLSVIDPFPLTPKSEVLWGVLFNHCTGTTLKNSNIFNWGGAGVVFRGDLGSGCVSDHNYACRIQGSNNRGDGNPLACEGSGFWMRPQHYMRNCVASNCLRYGYIMFGYGLSNPSRNEPLKQFDNNEGYSLSTHGFTFWYIQASGNGDVVQATVDNVINDFVLWHVSTDAVWQYHSYKFRVNRPIWLGNSARLASSGGGKAWNALDYYLRDYWIKDGEIKGFRVGLEIATIVGNRTKAPSQSTVPGVCLVENMRFYNRRNIMISVQFAGTGGGPKIGPREVRIKNCLFGRTNAPTSTSAFDIKACWIDDPDFSSEIHSSTIAEDKIYVEKYNQSTDPANTFRLYRSQQLATFSPVKTALEMSPQYPQLAEGSPESGLSNQQMFNTHGLKVLGEFCPATAITHPSGQIIGLTEVF